MAEQTPSNLSKRSVSPLFTSTVPGIIGFKTVPTSVKKIFLLKQTHHIHSFSWSDPSRYAIIMRGSWFWIKSFAIIAVALLLRYMQPFLNCSSYARFLYWIYAVVLLNAAIFKASSIGYCILYPVCLIPMNDFPEGNDCHSASTKKWTHSLFVW